MWKFVESIIVLVVIAVTAAWLACRAKKTLSGEDGCGGCGKEKSCKPTSLDTLSSGHTAEEDDDITA